MLEKVKVYDVWSFLAEIGGSLGLCFGLSILAVIDLGHYLHSIIVKFNVGSSKVMNKQ